MRYLFGSISDWGALFKEAFRVCKPGGYVESYEASNVFESDDGTVTDTSAMSQWANFFHLGGTKLGRPFTVVEDDMQKKFMEEAGFVDVQVWDFKVGDVQSHPHIRRFQLYYLDRVANLGGRDLGTSR